MCCSVESVPSYIDVLSFFLYCIRSYRIWVLTNYYCIEGWLKRNFFCTVSFLLYLLHHCSILTLIKWIEEKLRGNYTRMLWTILNKFLEATSVGSLTSRLISILVRYAEHYYRSKGKLFYEPLLMDMPERTYLH